MRLIKKVICPLLAVAIIFSTTSVCVDSLVAGYNMASVPEYSDDVFRNSDILRIVKCESRGRIKLFGEA